MVFEREIIEIVTFIEYLPTLHVQTAFFPLQIKEGSHSFITGFQTFFFLSCRSIFPAVGKSYMEPNIFYR